LDIQKQEFHYYSNGRKALDMQILIDFASSSFGKKASLNPFGELLQICNPELKLILHPLIFPPATYSLLKSFSKTLVA